jgi:hypothetical protein
MPTINQLPAVTQVSGGDQLPLYVTNQGDARRCSVTTLLNYFSQNFASPDYETIINAPTNSGFNVDLGQRSNNVFLILNPTGTFAAGSVTLPPVASCFDGQQIVLASSAAIGAFSINANGATVIGAPTGLNVGGGWTLRFSAIQDTWYCIASDPSASEISFIQAGAGAVVRSAESKMREIISVKDFGAACDAVYDSNFTASGTDDTVAIQAALDAAGAAGGGFVLLPGKSIISSTLYMPQGVFLVGQGANWGRGTNALTANPRNFIKSAIIHDPTATAFSMLKWQLGPDNGTSARGVGGGARDLFVDGQRVALACMDTMSWLNQNFQNVHTYDANPSTGIGWLFSAFGVLGTAGAGVNRTTAFGNAYSCSHTGTGPKALVLAGSGWFNTAHMAFYNFLAENGTIDFEDCDSNELHNSAGNLVLWGSVGPNQNPNGVAIGSARHNVMFGHRGSVTAKAGTSPPAVLHPNYHSHSNTVYGKTNDNNDQFPTIEAGADLTVWLPGFAKNDSRYGSFSVGGGVLQTRGSLPAATVSIADATSTDVDWTVPANPHRNFLGAWNAANPSRLTIPAGVKWVRFSAYIAWDVNGTGVRFASIIRNGNAASRVASSTMVGNASFLVSNIIQSGWLPIGPGESVQTGDYYEVRVRQESGGPLDMLRDEGSYFMVEFR